MDILGNFRTILWYIAFVMTALGFVALGLDLREIGLITVAIGGGTLALLSLATEFQLVFQSSTDQFVRLSIVTTGSAVFLTSLAISLNVLPTELQLPVRIVVLSLGLQALVITVDTRPAGTRRSRIFLLAVSHGAVFTGSFLILPFGPRVHEAAVLLYAVGFSFLILHAFWMRRLRPGVSPPKPDTRRRYWESLLLSAILIEIVAVVGLTITTRGLVLQSPLSTGFAIISGVSGTILLASLSVPPSPPDFLSYLTSPIGTITQHVLTVIILVNTLSYGLFLAFPMTFTLITGVFLFILAIGVVVNYSMLLRAYLQTPTKSSVPRTVISDTPFTVVITAMDEADVLRKTLQHNLTALPNTKFLVVPAAASNDGTHEVLADFHNEYDDQLRIIEGTAGSKAGDLNQVWPHIDTPFVLLLDADEQVSQDSVAHGLQTILSNPNLGIVQGRKVATHPDCSTLSKFTSIERQHSTWIDHPFIDTILEAGHFAGSSAILRRPAVSDVDGFATTALTEDIDLTIRMYLKTDWDLQYVPNMVLYEYNPGTWMSLIRQRERWGRGWAQTTARHISSILRNVQKLGWRRTTGLSWELFLAVSSPVFTIFPAIITYWIVNGVPPFDPWLMLFLAVVMFPERGLSFLYAAFWDPALSREKTGWQIASNLLYSYLWIPFGWVIQLHSLYLQLAGADERWEVTKKAVINEDET